MYFTYWKAESNGLWYWNLKAANHQIIANGEGYNNEQDVIHVIGLVKTSSDAPVNRA